MRRLIKVVLITIFFDICLSMLGYKVMALELDANADFSKEQFYELRDGDTVINVTKATTLWRSFDKYTRPYSWYCISYIQKMLDGTNIPSDYRTYKVVGVFDLKGKYVYDQNGNLYGNPNGYEKNVIAKFAHILSHNSGHGDRGQTAAQELVWHYFNNLATILGRSEWIDSSNPIINWDTMGIDGYVKHNDGSENGSIDKEYLKDGIGQIYEYNMQAENYASSLSDESGKEDLNISKNDTTPIVTKTEDNGNNYIEFGPLNIKYSGKITSLIVQDQSGDLVEINDETKNWTRNDHGIKFYKYNGENKVEINEKDIPNGDDFYIKFKIDLRTVNINKIKLKIKTEDVQIYNSRIVILEYLKGQEANCTAENTQRIMLARSDPNNNNLEATLEYDINIRGSLKIIKQDLDEPHTRLPRVKFTIKYKKADGTEEYILRNIYDSQQIYFGVSDWYNFGVGDGVNQDGWTNVFETDSNGEIFIDDMAIGTYEVKEIENPLPGFETHPNVSVNVEVKPLETTTETITNHQIIDLKIIKVDEDDHQHVLPGVGLKIQNTIIRDLNGGIGGYVKQDENGNITYVDEANATEFITDTNGEVTVSGVLTGIYAVIETKNPNPYYDNNPNNKVLRDGIVAYDALNGIERRVTIDVLTTNARTEIDLEIIKQDEYTKAPLQGVQFEIKFINSVGNFEYVVNNERGEQRYIGETDWNRDAGEDRKLEDPSANCTWTSIFTTDSDGKIFEEKVDFGTYIIKEIYNPNTYYERYPNKEFTVNVDKNNADAIYESADHTEYKFTYYAYNQRKYTDLSGYVWKDASYTGKDNIRDDLYTNEIYNVNEDGKQVQYRDEGFNNMIVRLKDGDGNIVKDLDGNPYEATTAELGKYPEIDGGEYFFKEVEIEQLENYYVEFEYDGLIYQSVNPNGLENNGSKAIDDSERETLDAKFDSINFDSKDLNGNQKVNFNKETEKIEYSATENNETSIKDSSACILHANTKEAKYTLTYSDQNYKDGIQELKYINLGIYQKPQADLALSQDLANVALKINDQEHVYNNSGTRTSEYKPWDVGVKFKNEYTNTYRRAIYKADAEFENKSDTSKELQVYLTYKIAIKNDSSYLTKVNSIVDYFDNNYTFIAAGTGINEQNEIIGVLLEESENEKHEEKYNDIYKKVTIPTNIEVGSEDQYIYVQFKVGRDKVLDMINSSEEELLYNIAEINSYTVYKDNNKNTVAAVDKDSVPGNIQVINERLNENKKSKFDVSTFEDDTEAAAPVKLVLANPRTISGSVFEDTVQTENGEDSNKILTGKVRQGDGKYTDDDKAIEGVEVVLHELNNSIPDKEFTTGADGNFNFEGYIPGKYTITYTWGDKTYKVQDYKGTIYDLSRDDLLRDQENTKWYKEDVDTRKSDAIDNYETRGDIDSQVSEITDNTIDEHINKAYNEGNDDKITITRMSSITPIMEFGIEYETDKEGPFNVKNVDFGIVERAKQKLQLAKRVKSFKITLSNGQILADVTVNEDGTLEGTTNHVTYMGPSSSNGYENKGFIKAEMDNELIEGSTLEIGYEIKAENKSELDYMSKEFYIYGDQLKKEQRGKVVTLTTSAIVDYLDKNLVYDYSNNEWKQISVTELKKASAKNTDKEYLNSKTVLQTDMAKIATTALIPGDSASVDLTVSKLLAASEEITFDNKAEVVKITKPNEPKESRGRRVEDFPESDSETVSITPSTGENRDYQTIIIISVISLICLTLGIVLIKKKAL